MVLERVTEGDLMSHFKKSLLSIGETGSARLHTDGMFSSLSHENCIAHWDIKLFGLPIKVSSGQKFKSGGGIVCDVVRLYSQHIMCGRQGLFTWI